jgi:transcriptional regulator NrdR family protein
MVCVQCHHKTQVINSRHQKRSNTVWRRRSCTNCGIIFTTNESADYGALWAVVAKNGRLSPFSRDKLMLSIYGSLQHRKTALSDAAGLADTVIARLAPSITGGSLSSASIKTTAQVALNRFDTLASTHYQAFHKE